MTTPPAVSPTAARLYTALGPLTAGDDAQGWPLLLLCAAVTDAVWQVESLAADTDTQVGWAALLDVTAAPAAALPWLGQFVGAQVGAGLTDDQARTLVAAAPGQWRGTVQSIHDAARLWLTGTQTVTITERAGGDPYAITVEVYASQVVDVAQLTAAVQAAKPAGLVLTLTILPGWKIAQMETETAGKTVAYVEATWATVDAFEHQVP